LQCLLSVPPERAEPRDEEERLDGWGFADTRFTVKPNGAVMLTGTRYTISNVELPKLLGWMGGKIASPLSYDNTHESHFPPAVPAARPSPMLQAALLEILQPDQIQVDDATRLRHGHGQTAEEMWKLRYDSIPRVPDVVVCPDSHDEVVALVEMAKKLGVCLIPFGGGTNVTDALRCDPSETRLIISVDMRQIGPPDRGPRFSPINLFT
jgi:alkyldihydroxyacetonephosphate synthase